MLLCHFKFSFKKDKLNFRFIGTLSLFISHRKNWFAARCECLHLLKVPITSVGILHICNLWILLKKIVIYLVGRKFHLDRLFCDVMLRRKC